MGDASTAEDLLQETWMRVVRSRDRYDPRRRFSTWLFQIANNLCRDRARRREVATRGGDQLRNASETSSDRSDDPDLRLDMERRLMALPDRLREVILLRYYRDLSEREIARIAGIPAGTVKSRLHHAVRVLREQQEEDDAD